MNLRNIVTGVEGRYIRTSDKPNYYGKYIIFVQTPFGKYYAPNDEWIEVK